MDTNATDGAANKENIMLKEGTSLTLIQNDNDVKALPLISLTL